MCGRYQVDANREAIEKHYGVQFTASFKPNYNVAPSQQMPVIREDEADVKQWGLPLKFGDKIFRKLINIRDDSFRKPWAKHYLRSQRCLIPSTGFYEWRRNDGHKTPFYIGTPGHGLFSFAGVYDEDTFAIITTAANPRMRQVHDRMPVMLTREEEKEWVNPDYVEDAPLMQLLHPYKSDLEIYPISPDVNNPRNNNERIFRKVTS